MVFLFISASARAQSPDSGSFFHRFAKSYLEDWNGTATSDPGDARRAPPSPLDSPPFPASDWNCGGSPDIGAPDTTVYPLMRAIYAGPDGKACGQPRQNYGWFNAGFNVSSSNRGKFANAPAAYYIDPNSIQPDQQVLYIERLPDTVQTDHVDWGFRFAQRYGMDYRFTTGKGYFSNQLLGKNNLYGYDPVMAYAIFTFRKWRRE